LRSLGWPGSIDSGAVTLRSHRKIKWAATRAITVQDYTEGHVSIPAAAATSLSARCATGTIGQVLGRSGCRPGQYTQTANRDLELNAAPLEQP
jgi:hypothetical protein